MDWFFWVGFSLFFTGIIISPFSTVAAQTLVPGIHGSSLVNAVKFTWIIISSDKEISINLRYLGNGTSPPILITATALLNESGNHTGYTKTLAGSKILNGGWASPNSITITINGDVSLYNAFLVNVIASLYTGCIPSPSYPDFCIPSPPPLLNCDQISRKNFRVLPPDPHGFDADNDGIGCET